MSTPTLTDAQIAALESNRGQIPSHDMNLFLDETIGSMDTEIIPDSAPSEGFIIPDEVYTIGVDKKGTPYAPLNVYFVHPNADQTYGSVAKEIQQLGRLPTKDEGERILRFFKGKDPKNSMPIRCLHQDDDGSFVRCGSTSGCARVSLKQRMGSATNKAFVVIVP